MNETRRWTEIAPPEDRQALAEELTPDSCIGRFKELSLHIIHGWEKPVCMAEIGRIREREFRVVGAGRNVARDTDSRDTTPGMYRQLIAWDPNRREVVSMYRFAETSRILRDFGLEGLRTYSLFQFSNRFRTQYLSHAIELGRSVVNSKAKHALPGLFAVWRGLGVLAAELHAVRYFFGNVTLPASMPAVARDLLLRYLYHHYSSDERRRMMRARHDLGYAFCTPEETQSPDPTAGREHLIQRFATLGSSVPPILLSYLGATEDLHVFDTARDSDFGGAWETALAVPLAAINARTRRRFLDCYEREPGGYFDSSTVRSACVSGPPTVAPIPSGSARPHGLGL